jgi:hypothetical protein
MFRTKVVEAFLHVTCPTLNVKKSTKKVEKKVLVPPLKRVVKNVTIMLLKGYINVAQVPQITPAYRKREREHGKGENYFCLTAAAQSTPRPQGHVRCVR